MTIRNLTPHTVTLLVGDRRVDVPASGILPRVVEQEAAAPPVTVSGVEVPVVEVRLGTVQGLPERAAGVSCWSREPSRRLTRTATTCWLRIGWSATPGARSWDVPRSPG